MRDLVFNLKGHLCKGLIESIWLEDRIPSKHVLSSGLNNLARASTHKEHRLRLWGLTKSIDTLGICSLIFEAFQNVDKTLPADFVQERFAKSKYDTESLTYTGRADPLTR